VARNERFTRHAYNIIQLDERWTRLAGQCLLLALPMSCINDLQGLKHTIKQRLNCTHRRDGGATRTCQSIKERKKHQERGNKQ
jgi:hypothetical protein